MARAHYIVRVGNVGIATTISERAPNHWHYLSPQYLWGLPKTMAHVKVRAQFETDIENPQVTAYIWFLCNGHGGPGHFVQVGIGRRHSVNGPVANRNLSIPEDMMARIKPRFDHWFSWRPVTPDPAFQDRQLLPATNTSPSIHSNPTPHHSATPILSAPPRSDRFRGTTTTNSSCDHSSTGNYTYPSRYRT